MAYANVNIRVPEDMVMYVTPKDTQEELVRNALLLYPYITSLAISHGKAAEILGIHKQELIEIYNNLGLAYLSMDIEDIDAELADWHCARGSAL